MSRLSNLAHHARRFKKPPKLMMQLGVARLHQLLGMHELEIPIRLEDITDSTAVTSRLTSAVRQTANATPRIAWVVVPPGAGSGGHTTLFRMIQAAQAAGFSNTLLFYQRYGSDFQRSAEIVHSGWPWLDCEIAPLGETIEGFDACVASSWPTAHVVGKRCAPGTAALYFIQDYEPYFHPRGDAYAFAEDSYRFGFRNIALGLMVHDTLVDELGIESTVVPFGGDTTAYRLLPGADRRGVVFYAKPGNERRGYRLAVLALEQFHRLHPDEPIHTFGDRTPGLPFPVTDHGRLDPAGLSALYNQVVAGLALSFTNVSLVPEEMLSAGVIPIVNDHRFARAVLTNPLIEWVDATPTALAAALSAAVTRKRHRRTARSRRVGV